ncbi:wd40 repeat-like protein [Stemphylium lycopersici]|nr:wd40 repeat-like protein [Stemphylium lycopersici]
MTCITRESFLNDYLCPLEPAHDFGNTGGPAHFAPSHPKEWSQADSALDFGANPSGNEGSSYNGYYTAVSPDKKLLAISTAAEGIQVYDIASRELRESLEGTGSVCFRPFAARRDDCESSLQTRLQTLDPSGYVLMSSVPSTRQSRNPRADQLILWDLDQHGRTLDKEEPIDPSAFSTKAIDAIAPELEKNHEWTRCFIDASTLHTKFAEALSQVAADHVRRHNTIIGNARLGGFGSVPFSKDGKLLLYHSNDETTQQGMRAPAHLPQVVVYDMDTGIEVHRLMGHTDAIMWSAISPSNKHIASVSWDGTMRMYSASTGGLEWVTEPSGGQSWAGAFSQDSQFVAWSSKSGCVVQISVFPGKFSNWCRTLEWHPSKPQLAMCAGNEAYVWDALDGFDGKTLQHFRLDDHRSLGSSMASIEAVGWLEEGRMLYLETSEGTKIVYDAESNTKEMFRRPAGVPAGYVHGGIYGLFTDEEGRDFYICVDGDRTVRYWRKGPAPAGSWWEKDPNPSASEKKAFPETGKYVKITKRPSKATMPEESSKDRADRGVHST